MLRSQFCQLRASGALDVWFGRLARGESERQLAARRWARRHGMAGDESQFEARFRIFEAFVLDRSLDLNDDRVAACYGGPRGALATLQWLVDEWVPSLPNDAFD